MIDLRSSLYGIPVTSPIIVGSCGLSNSIKNIQAFEKAGAGAIILKSIFEEEILLEHQQLLANRGAFDEDYEFLDYFDYEIKQQKLATYIQHIKQAKEAVSIPILASINCISVGEWIPFASEIEKAGADGIELNILPVPVDISKNSLDYEKEYTKIIQRVKTAVKIPVGVKIGHHYSSLGATIKRVTELSDGITLFNKPYAPDIDIDLKVIKAGPVFSNSNTYLESLRWIFLMAGACKEKMHASTGILSGDTLIKMLLAGAKSCQVVSGVYEEGPLFIKMLKESLLDWMGKNNYSDLSVVATALENKEKNAEYFLRSQFLKNFGSYEKEF